MGTINLVPYKPIAGTDSDASLIDNAFDTLQTLLNGNIDNNNVKAGAGIEISKLAALPGSIHCYAVASGTSVAADTLVALAFDSETLDTDTMHDNSTNPSRITFKTAGTYLVASNAYSGASWPAGVSQFGLYKNGTVVTGSIVGAAAGDGFVGAGRGTTFALIVAAVNDYAEAKIQQHGGGTVTVQGAILAIKIA